MAFAFGARTGVRRTVTPNSFTDLSSCWEKMLSLSWITYRYPWPPGSTSRKLLQGPLRGRMRGDVVMDHSPGRYFQDHEHVQSPEGGSHDGKEVVGHDHIGVVPDESQPSLLGIGGSHGTA